MAEPAFGGAVQWRALARPETERTILDAVSARQRVARDRVVIVHGRFGSGVTTMLDRIDVALRAGRRRRVVRIVGRNPDMDFAAVVPLAPADDDPPATPALLMQRIRRAVLATTDVRSPVLVVDGAHLIDDASWTVIQSLVDIDACPAIIGTEAIEPVLRHVDGRLVEIDPFSAEETTRQLELIFGTLDSKSARDLHRLSNGRPGILRELVELAAEASQIETRAGVTSITTPSIAPPSLEAALRRRRAALSPAADDLLGALALVGTVPHTLTSPELDELRRAGWLTPDGTQLGIAPQLVAAAGSDVVATVVDRVLNRLDAAQTSSFDAVTSATWKLAAGHPVSADMLRTAAQRASAAWNLQGALQFIDAVPRPSLDDRLRRADVLDRLGRTDAADDEWTRAMADAPTAAEAVRIASAHSDALALRRNDPVRAQQVLASINDEITDPSARLELLTASAMIAELTGDHASATAHHTEARHLLGAASPLARARYAVPTTYFEVMRGSLHDADALADATATMAAEWDTTPTPEIGMSLSRLLLTAVLRHQALGNLGEAHRIADEQVRLRSPDTPGLGVWLMTLADTERLMGTHDQAIRHLVAAESTLRYDDDLAIAKIAGADLAGLSAELGLPDAYRLLGPKPELHSDPRVQMRWQRAFVRVEAVAEPAILEIVDAGLALGFVTWSGEVLLEHLRRSTSPEAAARLASLASATNSPLFEAAGAAAVALASDHVLEAVRPVERLRALGAEAIAADFTCQLLERQDGQAPAGLVTAARRVCPPGSPLERRLVACGVPSEAAKLTPRQREIAELAAAGHASKRIAAQLGLSARTVDNHLGEIYRRLDIASRGALPDALRRAGVPPQR